jgi:hypothetical protein
MTTATPAVVYPDAEAVVGNWLAQQLEALAVGCSVARTVPSPRPRRFVTVQRTGGSRDTPVTDAAQLTVDCWAADHAAAAQLAATCRQLVEASVGADPFGVVVTRYEEVAGPTNYPDPTTNQPRYTFTVRLSLRGTPQTST